MFFSTFPFMMNCLFLLYILLFKTKENYPDTIILMLYMDWQETKIIGLTNPILHLSSIFFVKFSTERPRITILFQLQVLIFLLNSHLMREYLSLHFSSLSFYNFYFIFIYFIVCMLLFKRKTNRFEEACKCWIQKTIWRRRY